eukprot:gene7126-14494_t
MDADFAKIFAMLETNLPHWTPAIGALAVTSFIVLISGLFTGARKILFQSLCFAVAFAVALGKVISEKDLFEALWKDYIALSDDLKLALAVTAIGFAYFGGAMYIAGVTVGEIPSDDSNDTPATLDCVVAFDVPTSIPADDTKLFEWMFDRIKDEIIKDLPTIYELPKEAVAWTEKQVNYNVAGGKMNRGLATVSVHKTLALATGTPLTNKIRMQVAALGWCVEYLQAFFLVADDVMDASLTRRGNPCWFRLPDVQLVAINDSFILESFVFKILKRYLGGEKYYHQLVDLFIEATRQTEFGQLLDLTSQPQGGGIDLNRFTIERYCSIVKYKTAFYSFYLPVALGMIVSGITKRSHFDKAREILCIMGEYFQVQDDVLDCYGAPEVIGKVGTDIQDNKCSWLVVQALKKATPEQRRVLEENYGKHDESKIQKVKKLFNEMKLRELFEKYEHDSYERIQTLMGEVKDMPREVFEFLLRKIYKRAK